MNKNAKSIMIQGTMSNVGKSVVTAGLCRVFKQDGYKVAPFKSQNMALNSFITKDGLEMGRAQVMQAEAAGLEPSVLMNPILLKPTSDMGSQVIVNGEVFGTMKAADYYLEKKNLINTVLEAYQKLEQQYDIIVIEGAGSPAEINLKNDDIVNMGLAKRIKAPVLLVGDIDRGGVFAQLIGTIMLMEEEEQALIKGLIVNKFRGDRKNMESGLNMLKERSGKPVLGLMSYLQVDLEDEDSLSERFGRSKGNAPIDVAVIRVPKISNFTDFGVLEAREEINLRYISRAADLKNPDMIILPGTKNTMADLRWLRESGMEAAILKASRGNTLICGICGGFQMLGNSISDPLGVEDGGTMRGMELLPMKTLFAAEKVRTRVTGNVNSLTGEYAGLSGCEVEGYEIHMGTSELEAGIQPLLHLLDGDFAKFDGACRGNILGTYVHGIFDHPAFVNGILRLLYLKKGLAAEDISSYSYAAYKEKQYDILADAVRESLDMKRIYEILEKGSEA